MKIFRPLLRISLILLFLVAVTAFQSNEEYIEGIYPTHLSYKNKKVKDVGTSLYSGKKQVGFKLNGKKTKYTASDIWGYAYEGEDYRFMEDKLSYVILIPAENERQIAWYLWWSNNIHRNDSGDVTGITVNGGQWKGYLSRGSDGQGVTFNSKNLISLMKDRPKIVAAYKKDKEHYYVKTLKYVTLYNESFKD